NSLARLGDKRPVIFYDQLGCGQSALKPGPCLLGLWALPRFVHELEALIDTLKLTEYHLLGHSWGGTIAIDFLHKPRPGLQRLILASPFISHNRWLEDADRLLSALPHDIQSKLRAGPSHDEQYKVAIRTYYQNYLCRLKPWPPELPEAFDRLNFEIYHTLWGPSELMITGHLQAFERMPSLSQITIPTLLTCGRYDEASPQTLEIALHTIHKGLAQLIIFEQSSHVAHVEQPEAYLGTLRYFLLE
ncbi:MAG: proline iminopeptidase-family hydrolase, partial [Burkholderiales bacterium]|nr:proline iminopeptidase-family hydrolase [Burkholderiales bacterium]